MYARRWALIWAIGAAAMPARAFGAQDPRTTATVSVAAGSSATVSDATGPTRLAGVPDVVRAAADGPVVASSPPPGWAFAYSAVVPGAGQLAQGKHRWIAYAAFEGLAWFLYLDRRGDGRDLRDRYRTFAWEEARDRVGDRVVDDFEYYERLTQWTRSGTWDRDSTLDGIQPETDPTTFNGSIWERARGFFFGPDPGSIGPGDPEWQAALEFYAREAVGPTLLWSWEGTGDAQARFASLIEESDDRFGEATVALAVLVANHLISAADAFLSSRLRASTGGRVDASLRLDAPLRFAARGGPGGAAYAPRLRLGVTVR